MNSNMNVMLGWSIAQPKTRLMKEVLFSSTLCRRTGVLMLSPLNDGRHGVDPLVYGLQRLHIYSEVCVQV